MRPKRPYRIITRYTKTLGTAYDLDVVWQGQRLRPLLGYNLTPDEIATEADRMIATITNPLPGHIPPDQITLSQFVPIYWKVFNIKDRVERTRPENILALHLLPTFGARPLRSLTPLDGIEYVTQRKRDGAAPDTIIREFKLLLRILNLAVQQNILEKNLLKGTPLPNPVKRTRVATDEELTTLASSAHASAWRMALGTLNTGLRESALLALQRPQIVHRTDGPWLLMGTPRTPYKRYPPEIPLNRFALAALTPAIPVIPEERVFPPWTRETFAALWSRTVRRSTVSDLRFHDLRHTFATALQQLDIPHTVAQWLMGHLSPDMTTQYQHGGPGWNQKLRRAVTLLEAYWDDVYGLSIVSMADADKSRKSLKTWCPQRDLNPCCSLERAAS